MYLCYNFTHGHGLCIAKLYIVFRIYNFSSLTFPQGRDILIAYNYTIFETELKSVLAVSNDTSFNSLA